MWQCKKIYDRQAERVYRVCLIYLKNAFGKIKLPDKTKNKVWQNLRNVPKNPHTIYLKQNKKHRAPKML